MSASSPLGASHLPARLHSLELRHQAAWKELELAEHCGYCHANETLSQACPTLLQRTWIFYGLYVLFDVFIVSQHNWYAFRLWQLGTCLAFTPPLFLQRILFTLKTKLNKGSMKRVGWGEQSQTNQNRTSPKMHRNKPRWLEEVKYFK